jgi:dTDP-3-amino-3,4,6-trideoxy-alpha-D-glucose transaminase
VTVPFLDLAASYRELRRELDDAYARVMTSGRFVLGDEVEAFEAEFASHCGARNAVGVGNGLDALTIALRASDVGPGDEVAVPAHTFIATWLAVERVGARVVPVDVNADTLLMDVDAAASAVTSRTAAIVPVHLYGQPADMTALKDLASRKRLLLLGDAAQAHGARWQDHDVGALGNAAAFSFYPAKNLGAFGDGGAVTTGDDMLAIRIRRLRNYGASDSYTFAEPGVNSRLDSLQAAFLRVKLRALDRWNGRRAAIADAYFAGLPGTVGLVLPTPGAEGTTPVWHLFCVRHPHRDALARHLAALGVMTQIHYPIPPHRSEAFAHLSLPSDAFPVTNAAAATLLSLPIGPHLGDGHVERVIEAVRGYSAQVE